MCRNHATDALNSHHISLPTTKIYFLSKSHHSADKLQHVLMSNRETHFLGVICVEERYVECSDHAMTGSL